ncbi:MAG: threonine synthase [Sphingopyxis sp.]
MLYQSTRGASSLLNFRDATLAGLAPDGGLYLPQSWPQFSAQEISDLAGCDYAETAARVLAPFVGDCLSGEELRDLTRAAYGAFSHDAVTPLVQLDARHWLLELFHGPTLAFKDIALQLLGRLFERFLSGTDTRLTIVGVTSGDTGSAAINAVVGRAQISIVMLHPAGRVSEVQRRQMTTVLADNVHNVAIGGSFDDAQAMVKRMFADPAVTSQRSLSAVNSINWARLAAQLVYYFYAAVRLGAPHRQVAFSVPTGNFGDVFAGHVAAQMGLPIAKLIVATNVNDILHRALSTGDYSAGTVVPTATPSMDIQVSSNFERLLFDVGGRDGPALAAQMRGFEASGTMQLTNSQRTCAARLMSSARIDGEAMAGAMRWAWSQAGQLIDPHTAVGLAAALDDGLDPAIPMVTLATAHPCKFGDAVLAETGQVPPLPARLGNIFEAEERYTQLSGDYAEVRDYVLKVTSP